MLKDEMAKGGTLGFLHIELKAARTFVALAKRTRFKDKVVRNIANARKACPAVRHFMGLVELSRDEAAEIVGMLADVENELAMLGRVY